MGFLYGFSLGGLISAYIASDNGYLVDYLILESPALNLAEENRKLVEKYYSFCRFAEITGIMKVPFIGGAKFDATPGERPSYSKNKTFEMSYFHGDWRGRQDHRSGRESEARRCMQSGHLLIQGLLSLYS